MRRFFLSLRAHTLALPPIGFALRNVQTHISKQFRIEMCVCTLLKANIMGGRVRAHALKDKINFAGNNEDNLDEKQQRVLPL